MGRIEPPHGSPHERLPLEDVRPTRLCQSGSFQHGGEPTGFGELPTHPRNDH